MSDKYTSEFKAKVALEAVSQSKTIVADIADKYDLSEEEVIEWAKQLQDDAVQVFAGSQADSHSVSDAHEDVELETEDEEFAVAVEHGVMNDELNYSKLIFWSTFGTALVIVFVIGLVYFSQYSIFETQKEVSAGSSYTELTELKESQNAELNSFGVVNPEEGIYRIPIDSAISRMTAQ